MASPLEVKLRGVWHEHLKKLKRAEEEFASGDPKLHYSVPRIVAIGMESSGKSSTLERLAMLEFFPSDRRLCTRMPIELRLRHRFADNLPDEFKETGFVRMSLLRSPGSRMGEVPSVGPLAPADVATQVRTWMEQVIQEENSELVGITKDRLVIELFSTRELNLDLIDLPGIVGGSIKNEPANMMEQTREVAASFLEDPEHPHTFVVAVAPAKDNCIRNSQAMQLVQEYKKERMAVGVLTHADCTKDHRDGLDDPFARLKELTNGDAEDLPAFEHGYVVLMNRDTTMPSKPSLEEINQLEKAWFSANLQTKLGNCGIDALTTKLVDLLETYTTNSWHVLESERLRAEREKLKRRAAELGRFIPSSVDELIAKSLELLPAGEQIWRYSEIELCCAEVCRLPAWTKSMFGEQSPARQWQINISFPVTSQLETARNMNGWILHAQLSSKSQVEMSALKMGSPEGGPFIFGASSPSPSSAYSEPAGTNPRCGAKPSAALHRRQGIRARRPGQGSASAPHVPTHQPQVTRMDESSVNSLLNYFESTLSTIPRASNGNLLIFCGEEVQRNSFVGVYGQLDGSSQGTIYLNEEFPASPSPAFGGPRAVRSSQYAVQKVGSKQFRDQLKGFCDKSVLSSSWGFDKPPCELGRFSAEALGLPINYCLGQPTDLSKCIFTKNVVRRQGSERIFVVLTLEGANPSPTAFPSVNGVDDMGASIRWEDSIHKTIEDACENIIRSHAEAILTHITLCDPRFPVFHEAMRTAVHEWSDVVTSAVVHRMDAWLTFFLASGAPDSIPIPRLESIRRLFSPSSGMKSFCNPLTIMLSRTIFMELQRFPLRSFLASEQCKGLILKFDSEEKPLCQESCASERKAIEEKICAVTGMLNSLHDVFQHHDHDDGDVAGVVGTEGEVVHGHVEVRGGACSLTASAD